MSWLENAPNVDGIDKKKWKTWVDVP